jgi:hypothetical protein
LGHLRPLGARLAGDAEIAHLHALPSLVGVVLARLVLAHEHQVVRLEIAMNDPHPVRLDQRPARVADDRERLALAEGPALAEDARDRAALDELHHHVMQPAVLVDLDEVGRVRPAHRGERPRLFAKSLEKHRVPRDLRPHDLHRDARAGPEVHALPDLSHPPFAEPSHEVIPAELRALLYGRGLVALVRGVADGVARTDGAPRERVSPLAQLHRPLGGARPIVGVSRYERPDQRAQRIAHRARPVRARLLRARVAAREHREPEHPQRVQVRRRVRRRSCAQLWCDAHPRPRAALYVHARAGELDVRVSFGVDPHGVRAERAVRERQSMPRAQRKRQPIEHGRAKGGLERAALAQTVAERRSRRGLDGEDRVVPVEVEQRELANARDVDAIHECEAVRERAPPRGVAANRRDEPQLELALIEGVARSHRGPIDAGRQKALGYETRSLSFECHRNRLAP